MNRSCAVQLLNSTASKKGGGIFMTESSLFIQDNCVLKFVSNTAGLMGGGIHALFSNITLSPQKDIVSVEFIDNYAPLGGSINLEFFSILFVQNEKLGNGTALSLTRNSAVYG